LTQVPISSNADVLNTTTNINKPPQNGDLELSPRPKNTNKSGVSQMSKIGEVDKKYSSNMVVSKNSNKSLNNKNIGKKQSQLSQGETSKVKRDTGSEEIDDYAEEQNEFELDADKSGSQILRGGHAEGSKLSQYSK
jgi:hypothetical protein